MRSPITRRDALVLVVLLLLSWGASTLWRQHLDRQDAPQLQRLARSGDILMLSSNTCSFCTRARQWLKAHQVPFDECFIETDARCAAQYRAVMAQGTPTLLVRGQVQIGFSPRRVAERLAQPG